MNRVTGWSLAVGAAICLSLTFVLLMQSQASLGAGWEQPAFWRSLITAGVAFSLAAIVLSLIVIRTLGEIGRWSLSSFNWALLAGLAGGLGVVFLMLGSRLGAGFGVAFPVACGGGLVVMAVVARLLSLTLAAPRHGMLFVFGAILVAIGCAGIIGFESFAAVEADVSRNHAVGDAVGQRVNANPFCPADMGASPGRKLVLGQTLKSRWLAPKPLDTIGRSSLGHWPVSARLSPGFGNSIAITAGSAMLHNFRGEADGSAMLHNFRVAKDYALLAFGMNPAEWFQDPEEQPPQQQEPGKGEVPKQPDPEPVQEPPQQAVPKQVAQRQSVEQRVAADPEPEIRKPAANQAPAKAQKFQAGNHQEPGGNPPPDADRKPTGGQEPPVDQPPPGPPRPAGQPPGPDEQPLPRLPDRQVPGQPIFQPAVAEAMVDKDGGGPDRRDDPAVGNPLAPNPRPGANQPPIAALRPENVGNLDDPDGEQVEQPIDEAAAPGDEPTEQTLADRAVAVLVSIVLGLCSALGLGASLPLLRRAQFSSQGSWMRVVVFGGTALLVIAGLVPAAVQLTGLVPDPGRWSFVGLAAAVVAGGLGAVGLVLLGGSLKSAGAGNPWISLALLLPLVTLGSRGLAYHQLPSIPGLVALAILTAGAGLVLAATPLNVPVAFESAELESESEQVDE